MLNANTIGGVAGRAVAGMMRPQIKTHVTKTSSHIYVDMISASADQSVRILANYLDFSFLGPRKQFILFQNVNELMKDIKEFVPHALKNWGATAIGSAGDMKDIMKSFKYSSPETYAQELSWLIQLV